jgi:hypothetical protein
MNRFSLLALLLLSLLKAAAQDNTVSTIPVYSNNLYIGEFIKGHANFPNCNPLFFEELKYAIQTNGNKDWHQYYGFPKIGVSIVIGNLGNENIYGQSVGIIPNVAFHTLGDKKINVSYHLGVGLSYFTKYHNEESDKDNMLIGSRIANITILSVEFSHNLSQYFSIHGGFGFVHCSNGHYQLPNIGMNIPNINAGVSYRPHGQFKVKVKDKTQVTKGKIVKLNIATAIGVHEFGSAIGPVGQGKYPVYESAAFLSRMMSNYRKINIGLNVRYYDNYYRYCLNHQWYQNDEKEKSYVFGLFAGYEMTANHWGYYVETGYNFYTPLYRRVFFLTDHWVNNNSWTANHISNKLGIQYYLYEPQERKGYNLAFGIHLKTNFTQADYIASGLTFSF